MGCHRRQPIAAQSRLLIPIIVKYDLLRRFGAFLNTRDEKGKLKEERFIPDAAISEGRSVLENSLRTVVRGPSDPPSAAPRPLRFFAVIRISS